MMKRALAILTITAVFGFGMICPVMAAPSMTKSYKVSVTLPEMVGTISDELASKARVTVFKLTDPRKHTEETVIVMDGEQILLRTTVVQ